MNPTARPKHGLFALIQTSAMQAGMAALNAAAALGWYKGTHQQQEEEQVMLKGKASLACLRKGHPLHELECPGPACAKELQPQH